MVIVADDDAGLAEPRQQFGEAVVVGGLEVVDVKLALLQVGRVDVYRRAIGVVDLGDHLEAVDPLDRHVAHAPPPGGDAIDHGTETPAAVSAPGGPATGKTDMQSVGPRDPVAAHPGEDEEVKGPLDVRGLPRGLPGQGVPRYCEDFLVCPGASQAAVELRPEFRVLNDEGQIDQIGVEVVYVLVAGDGFLE